MRANSHVSADYWNEFFEYESNSAVLSQEFFTNAEEGA
jgi:hypothetical protein